MPSSGGSYVFLERTYGPLFGTISGLGLWASFMLKSAFSLIGFSAYFIFITTFFDVEMTMLTLSLSALLLITVVNIMGVSKIKTIQTPIVVTTVGLLLGMCIMALRASNFNASVPLDGAFSTDIWTLAETAGFVFVAYAGVTKVAAIGDEVKDPEKNLPAGILLSLVIATVVYSLLAFMMMAAIPGEWWFNEDGKVVEDPISVFAAELAGSTFGVVVAIVSVLTMISMALAGILASSRFLFAMARDNLLSPKLQEMNAKYETPHWAILATGLVMGMAILLLPLKDVVKLASGFKIMIFIMINTCVIILRQTSENHEWNPTYKGPLYPFMQIWGIVAGCFLISLLGTKAFIGGAVAVVAGIITYHAYGKKHYTGPEQTPFKTYRASLGSKKA